VHIRAGGAPGIVESRGGKQCLCCLFEGAAPRYLSYRLQILCRYELNGGTAGFGIGKRRRGESARCSLLCYINVTQRSVATGSWCVLCVVRCVGDEVLACEYVSCSWEMLAYALCPVSVSRVPPPPYLFFLGLSRHRRHNTQPISNDITRSPGASGRSF
jgi:hypothetical protein